MPARHRRPVAPRQINKRALGAGASGLALALAAAPLAHAAQTTQPVADTASSADPSSSTAPSSSPATSSSSSAPSSTAPASPTPSSTPPSSTSASSPSSAPSSSAPSSSSSPKSARPKAARALAAPNYGSRKIYVGAQLDNGSYYPDGTTTVGSTIQIVETGPDAPGGLTQTCTTAAPNGPGTSSPGDSSCYAFLDGYEPAGDDTVTITQLTAEPNTVLDPMTFTSVPCVATADPTNPDVPVCNTQSTDATFTDAGVPPSVTEADATVTVPVGKSSTVDVDGEQIDTHGAPPTSVDVTTDPTHGTVAVVSDSAAAARATTTPVTGAFHFVYTPTNGYAGPDSFAYTESTANGTAGPVTVSLRVVGPAPTAHDDSATTKEGAAVSADVLANDDANGGGTLDLDSATNGKHGSTAIVDGEVRYTPAAGFSGTDSFDYTASTYSGTATATVRVTVTAPAASSSASSSSATTVPPANGNGNGAAPDTTGTAETGTPSAELLAIAGGLLLAGAGTTVAGRRRRSRSRHA